MERPTAVASLAAVALSLKNAHLLLLLLALLLVLRTRACISMFWLTFCRYIMKGSMLFEEQNKPKGGQACGAMKGGGGAACGCLL